MARFEAEHNIPLHSWQSFTIFNIYRRYFHDLEWSERGTNIIHR